MYRGNCERVSKAFKAKGIGFVSEGKRKNGSYSEGGFGRKRTVFWRIFIGKENPHEELAQSSIIVTKYVVNDENYGSIGIVGPTRMNYANTIAKLEYTAALLGNMLNNIFNLE